MNNITQSGDTTTPKSYVEDYIEFNKNHSTTNEDNFIEFDRQWAKFTETHKVLRDNSNNIFNKLFSKNLLPFQTLDFHDSYIVSNVKPEKDNQFSIEFRLMRFDNYDNSRTSSEDGNNVKFYFDDKHRDNFRSFGNKTQTVMAVMYDGNQLGIVALTQANKYRGFVFNNITINEVEVTPAISRKKKLIW